MPTWIFTLVTKFPTLLTEGEAVVTALETIASSDAAKSAEQAVKDFISHITPGKPNSPALNG